MPAAFPAQKNTIVEQEAQTLPHSAIRTAPFSIPGSALIMLIQTVLSEGSGLRFQAVGSSMVPLIREGDMITLSRIEGLPGIGDVVAFASSSKKTITIHRITNASSLAYLVCGDNNQDPDPPISRDDMLGKVIRIERNGKRLRFGLGPERRFIAFLSRNRILSPLMKSAHLMMSACKAVR